MNIIYICEYGRPRLKDIKEQIKILEHNKLQKFNYMNITADDGNCIYFLKVVNKDRPPFVKVCTLNLNDVKQFEQNSNSGGWKINVSNDKYKDISEKCEFTCGKILFNYHEAKHAADIINNSAYADC